MSSTETRRVGSAPEAAELDAAERLSIDELRALQLDRLRWTLRHAYQNVGFYRRKFDEAGVHPDDCKSLADLAKFPFTTKQDLRENYPFGMFAVPRQEVSRIHASSGTTGKPTVVGYTAADIDTWAGVVARSIRAAGAGRARPCTSHTAMACSPVASALTTVPRSSAAPSFPPPAA